MKPVNQFVCYAAWFVLGITIFMGGIDNLDSGWNLKVINAVYGLDIVDSAFFYSMEPAGWINLGYGMVFLGFFMCAGSSFLLGLWLAEAVHGPLQPA